MTQDTTSEFLTQIGRDAWTAKKPEQNGFYWVKRLESLISEPAIKTIMRVVAGWAAFIDSDFLVPVDDINDDLLFSGPIRPPE